MNFIRLRTLRLVFPVSRIAYCAPRMASSMGTSNQYNLIMSETEITVVAVGSNPPTPASTVLVAEESPLCLEVSVCLASLYQK